MCSVAEPDFEDSALCMESNNTRKLMGASCKRCAAMKADVVLRAKDAYCRDCFLSSVTHKFRATLGKSRMLKGNERVLIAVSGSQASFALLHLVKEGLEMTNHKVLQCTPHAIYIDEGGVLGLTMDERQALQTEICKLMRNYGFPTFISSLSKSLNCEKENCFSQVDVDNISFSCDSEESALCSLFDPLTLSAKEDLMLKLRHKLLVSIAEKLKCSIVFVGDTNTDLAVKVMANLSLGRGAQLPLDVGFSDTRYGAVHIVRPIRDISRKEVAMYNHFMGIESVCVPSFSTKAEPQASIQKLTEKFVVGLQTEFPSTVSTIFRTGDKFSLEGAGDSAGDACVLCQAPLDTSYLSSSALQATNFSRLVSSLGPEKFNSLTEAEIEQRTMNSEDGFKSDNGSTSSGCCSSEAASATCGCQRKEKEITVPQLMKWLCYGCRLIVREKDSVANLPDDVLRSLRDLRIRNHMKKEIQDFLL